jgi:hypothetical protein
MHNASRLLLVCPVFGKLVSYVPFDVTFRLITNHYFRSLMPGSCSVYANRTLFKVSWAFNMSCDVLGETAFCLTLLSLLTQCPVFIAPFPIIWNMRLPRREKRAVIAVFGLGILTLGACLARFITLTLVITVTPLCTDTSSLSSCADLLIMSFKIYSVLQS